MLPCRVQCINCGAAYPPSEIRYTCECGGLLEVEHDLGKLRSQVSRELFDSRNSSFAIRHSQIANCSGVWRYRELVLPVPEESIISRPEGNTALYHNPHLAQWVGVEEFYLKHEGENPTGSFKDRGMTVGVTYAKLLGMKAVACASTGNTSASMAAYAALAGLKAVVFIPEGMIAFGKLAQALAYGAITLQVKGNFDTAMALVREASPALGMYLLNSLNPFRLEGQKTIVFELIHQLGWEPPDWIALPAGNLGNTAAFGKALREMKEVGLIEKVPRLLAVQAEGAAPFYRGFVNGFRKREQATPNTVATAIKIGNPVSYERAIRAIRYTDGVVFAVSDQEIMDAKAQIDRAGIGCEPASAASVAGVRKAVREGIIRPGERVVAVLTGHLLKDPGATVDYHLGRLNGIKPTYANRPVTIEAGLREVERVINSA
ncbi:MAG TPA: threonine synthase [Chloroflexi bacterium]|nr:threonine synthase [Chloroflexota bacterium]